MPQNAIRNHVSKLAATLEETPSNELYQAIVDLPFVDRLQAVNLDLGIISLALKNDKMKTIDRIAISATAPAIEVVSKSYKPFHSVKIPLKAEENLLVKAMSTGARQLTSDWNLLLTPALEPSDANLDQATSAIGCSVVVPFKTKTIKGVLIYDFHQMPDAISNLHFLFTDTYTIAVERILSSRQKELVV